MRLINDHNVTIVDQKMELNCMFKLAVRRKEADMVIGAFSDVYGIELLENK